jgi:hypothetical protein
MTSKTLIVALALLVGATSATLAQGSRHHRALYNYTGAPVTQSGNSYNPATSGYDPGAETQR